jgi:hypothetical protein
MKIRSLLLGSVAAAGLSTGAYAADLGVLTAVNVCDELGLSGLVIASDTNCLQISGEVKYEFQWGDYKSGPAVPPTDLVILDTEDGDYAIPIPSVLGSPPFDWKSRVDAFIKFVATANSDFGPAKAVIKIKETQLIEGRGNGLFAGAFPVGGVVFGGSDTADGDGYYFDEAYVSIGDATVIMAGKKGTIMNFGDDEPLNYLGLFNSEDVDVGVKWYPDAIGDGGHVLQVTSDLGNGVSVAAGLENLNSMNAFRAGTVTGVIAYAGDGISAHLTVAGAGWLDGLVETWGLHAGVSGTFDPIKFKAAVSANTLPTGGTYWNTLGSVSATFDMFTIAVSGEAASDTDGAAWNPMALGGGSFPTLTGDIDVGAGGSISVAATDTVTINLGGRWYHDALTANDAVQGEAQLVAAVTETLTLTGALGFVDSDTIAGVFYGSAQVAWAPGGGFTSSFKGEAYSNGAWRLTTKAAKTFE